MTLSILMKQSDITVNTIRRGYGNMKQKIWFEPAGLNRNVRNTTLWDKVKKFFNDNVHTIVSRKQLLNYIINEKEIKKTTTIDTYRNYLEKAKFLNKVMIDDNPKLGFYYVPDLIPMDLSIQDAITLAYKSNEITNTSSTSLSAGRYKIDVWSSWKDKIEDWKDIAYEWNQEWIDDDRKEWISRYNPYYPYKKKAKENKPYKKKAKWKNRNNNEFLTEEDMKIK